MTLERMAKQEDMRLGYFAFFPRPQNKTHHCCVKHANQNQGHFDLQEVPVGGQEEDIDGTQTSRLGLKGSG